MNLKDTNGRVFATVLRSGQDDDAGVLWAAGAFDAVPQARRVYREGRRSDLIFAFYVEDAKVDSYTYTPPRVWGIAHSQTPDGAGFCIRNTPFNPRHAQSTLDVYRIGALQMLKSWPKLSARCFFSDTESTESGSRADHVMGLVNTFIKPVGEGRKP